MRFVGSWPNRKAGKDTEVIIDLSDRGGTLIIKREVSPRMTRVSAYAMASKCQLRSKVWPLETIGNAACVKE
jgi:hypothetical protein